MKIKMLFNNINAYNGSPNVRISVNNDILYEGVVGPSYQFDINPEDSNTLVVEHYGKTDADTLVENGGIVADKNFTLEKIVIDEYDIEELIWDSVFVDAHNNTIPGCLFFGPNGAFKLKFEAPVLKWMLKTRHQKNNNDASWEEDYEYFVNACKLVEELA